MRRLRRSAAGVVAGALLSAAASTRAAAQSMVARDAVRPVGTEVRVFAPQVLDGTPWASPWFSGRLVAADSAGVTLRTAAGATVTIPRSFVADFAVRAGRADHARSIVQGALAGAALGLLVGKVSTPPGSPSSTGEPTRHLRNGVVIGLLVGATFGNFNPWHRWAQAPLPTRTSPGE